MEEERESGHTSHLTVDRWIDDFQRAACRHIDNNPVTFETKYRERAAAAKKGGRGPRKPPMKRPMKKVPMKSKFAKQAQGNAARKKKVIMADETFLNKGKRSKLNKNARPKKDQVWLRGAVLQGDSNAFVFRVLDHPADALDGRPRGAKEMLANLRLIGLRKEDVFVSDKWGGHCVGREEAPRRERLAAHQAAARDCQPLRGRDRERQRVLHERHRGEVERGEALDSLQVRRAPSPAPFPWQMEESSEGVPVPQDLRDPDARLWQFLHRPSESAYRSHRRALSASTAVHARLSRGA